MDDQPIQDSAHPLQAPHLQGPHLDVRPDGRPGFAPLKLLVSPGRTRVEVTGTQAIVGRHSEADIRLAFPEVSRRHARLLYENGQWRIVDLDSLNGVWINSDRMHDAVLYDGDRIRIGHCMLTVEQGTAVRVLTGPRPNDPEIDMLKKIADVLPRQAG
ncbi:MAG: FHA domain-containing protein [Gemmataceae bacterium]|nr:FHA domain-containing protein [Gemmataceae bacterium]